LDAVLLTQTLVRIDSCNPPGRESEVSRALAALLDEAGLRTQTVPLAPDRPNLMATWPGSDADLPPLVLTGHMDTVPIGDQPWARDAFCAEIEAGRMYGRGTADMKAGIGSMIEGLLSRIRTKQPLRRGVVLVLTAAEETGCLGAHALTRSSAVPKAASAVLVAEPTGNQLMRGHKGILCLRARYKGVSAHSSMPERGQNAIYRAARAVGALEQASLVSFGRDPLLGNHTLNVGLFRGGLNYNSVPDHAEFTVDVRTNGRVQHDVLAESIHSLLGSDAQVQREIDLRAVITPATDPFLKLVAAVGSDQWGPAFTAGTQAVPFFTDAAQLQPFWGCPVAIVGPGETEQAHRTDESCSVEAIRQCAQFYASIIDAWCS
jgi:succinyl-diaminopimelate desuccinylase